MCAGSAQHMLQGNASQGTEKWDWLKTEETPDWTQTSNVEEYQSWHSTISWILWTHTDGYVSSSSLVRWVSQSRAGSPPYSLTLQKFRGRSWKTRSAEQRTLLKSTLFNHSHKCWRQIDRYTWEQQKPCRVLHWKQTFWWSIWINPSVCLFFYSNPLPPCCKVFHLLLELLPVIPQRWKSTNLFGSLI